MFLSIGVAVCYTLLSGFHYYIVCVSACVIEELKSPGLAHPIVVKLGKVRA